MVETGDFFNWKVRIKLWKCGSFDTSYPEIYFFSTCLDRNKIAWVNGDMVEQNIVS